MPLSVTTSTPLGIVPGTHTWCQLVARHQGSLLQPTLTATLLGLDAPQGPPCRISPAGRRKSFAIKLTRFSYIQTYIGRECLENQPGMFLLAESVCYDCFGTIGAKLEPPLNYYAPIYV